MAFVADDLAAWLIGFLADRGRRRLSTVLLGTDQERALRSAAAAAVKRTARDLCPQDDGQAERLALVISQVFSKPTPDVSMAEHQVVLESLQAGIATQLAVLDNASLTETGQSSTDLLGVPGPVLAEELTARLLWEILVRGSRGGPLFPLASQLNDDMTFLQGQRIEGLVGKLAEDVRDALARLDSAHTAVPPIAPDQLPPVTAGLASGRLPHRVRSGYIEQVRRIAPHQGLVGREAELVDLAAFCTAESGASYAWWRAVAWAGKSALLSWFVLHPPPAVDIVSFFVTARFAGQDNRVAFTEVVLEQLAAMLGQDIPPLLTPATREGHLLRMLAEAAEVCQAMGGRLILVVDGLDEDTGVTTKHDAYSIAALLPQVPAGGLRVIVAGRPDPPVPADVPVSHPLRDPKIVRILARSEHQRWFRLTLNEGCSGSCKGRAWNRICSAWSPRRAVA